MIGAYEGDLIRPLGLVTLYFAYAEGEIDELLGVLNAQQSSPTPTLNWPVGQKISRALFLVQELKDPRLNGLIETLQEAQELTGRRNQLVHGRLFAGGRLVSPNRNTPDIHISAEDIEQLAERIFSCKEYIFMHRCRHLLLALGGNAGVSGGT